MPSSLSKDYKMYSLGPEDQPGEECSLLLIYTGGTIGMDYDPTGSFLQPFDFQHILQVVPELMRFEYRLTVLERRKPIDSSDIQVEDWQHFAKAIFEFYDQYDGFVILHGTDTMAYTASALSFMLQNLRKPVILTGSQLPMGQRRTDARENLITTLEIAARKDKNGQAAVQEVAIFFDNLLLRGNRASKTQSENFTAFTSENYPPLAEVGIHINFNWSKLWRTAPGKQLLLQDKLSEDVGLLWIFPGMSREYVESILSSGVRGVVMASYGAGNIPLATWFSSLLANYVKKGLLVVNISQCKGGAVHPGVYENSTLLTKIGVINGYDLTTEAALTKLMWALAQSEGKVEKTKKYLLSVLSGEY